MLIKNFFIAFLIFFSMSIYAENQFIVKDIQFRGLRNFSQNEALKNIAFSIGNKISQHDIKKSIKSLFQTGKFENVKVVFSDKTVIFSMRERPIISNVVFFGNHIINSSILDAHLKKLNIEKGKPFNEFFSNIVIKTIRDFYLEIGRHKPDVKISKNFLQNNTVNLKILINEGKEVKINNIKILGIQKFSQEKILSFLSLKDHHSWWNFLKKSNYSPKALNNDLENLKNFYLNHGYLNFNVDSKKVNFLNNQNKVDITINVSEGEQYKISNVFINGNMFPYKESIEKLINIYPNELYNKEKISIVLNKITRFLSEYGYIKSKVIVDPQVNNEKKTIVLNFNIDINNRYFVNKIYFLGNEITQDKVMRRKIKQMEGKSLNIKLVELGKKLLEKTRYFSEVKIFQQPHSDDSNQVDITYKVKEKNTGFINFGLGYGVDSGVSVNLAFSQDNIFGSGNSLKSSIIKNDHQKYADISIGYPYFFSNGIDLNSRFFYNDFLYDLNSNSEILEKTYGLEGNTGFVINDFNTVNFGLGYTHNSINNVEKKTNNISSIKKTLDKIFSNHSSANDFSLNYSWIHDNTKYLYFPISGNQIFFSGKATLPGSDNNFYKMTLESNQYIPLNKEKSFIFLHHTYMGIGDSFNKEKLPFYENFYTNSENNVRGFRVNSIGPKEIYKNVDAKKCIGNKKNSKFCESIDSMGGNLAFISNLELVVPLPFIDNQYAKFFRASMFLDTGNIWNFNSKKINSTNFVSFLEDKITNDIYSSFGLSLEWFSPIGPLVFSYAIPIKKNKDAQLQPFQFNIGKHW